MSFAEERLQHQTEAVRGTGRLPQTTIFRAQLSTSSPKVLKVELPKPQPHIHCGWHLEVTHATLQHCRAKATSTPNLGFRSLGLPYMHIVDRRMARRQEIRATAPPKGFAVGTPLHRLSPGNLGAGSRDQFVQIEEDCELLTRGSHLVLPLTAVAILNCGLRILDSSC